MEIRKNTFSFFSIVFENRSPFVDIESYEFANPDFNPLPDDKF